MLILSQGALTSNCKLYPGGENFLNITYYGQGFYIVNFFKIVTFMTSFVIFPEEFLFEMYKLYIFKVFIV